MSSISSDIEKYLKHCKTRCSLTQFVDLNKKDTKIYIHQFDTETQAKKNLEKKYTDAFKTVFPNRQRITGKSIDVGILYAEARAERKTLMEGYKTLEAGVSEARRAILNNLNANTNESRSEVDEVDDADKENEEDIDDDHDYASNGYNIKQGFREFTTISRNLAKSQGLFVNGNLQQLLALNDVLLLVKNQHCQEIITSIGIANLACYHKDLRNEYLDMGMRVDKHLVGELESVMTTIEDSSRKNIKCQIFQLYEAADDLDTKVLDIFLAYVDKLPEEPLLNHEIKEIELITKYLDPLLNGMLNNHDKNHSFMWTNTLGTGTDDERPDAEMFFLKQRTADYTVGYCEVKINESNSNSLDIHYDMLRLTKFGKNICDEENLESALIVMVVGFKLVFYMIVLRNSNFYTMFEIYSIDVPQSFNSLPILMTSIHKIKQIIHMYQSYCVKRPFESPKRRRSRSMSKKEYSQIINYMKPKKMKPSLSFK